MADDAEGLTPPRPKRRRDQGIRSTRRPRHEAADERESTADALATAEAEAAAGLGAAAGLEAAAAAAEPSPEPVDAGADPERPNPIERLRSQLKAAAAARPMRREPTRAHPPTDALPATGAPVAGALVGAVPTLEAVERHRAADDERRRQLWRDSATILIGVVLALLLGQTFFPASVASPTEEPTTLPTEPIQIGTIGPPVSLPPVPTFGPIIDPSLGIDRTPTPIPVITMGPTPTPTPTPGPSPTKKPSPKPTTKATPKPTAAPTEKAPPDPTPKSPEAGFTWAVTLLSVGFTSTSSNESSWSWDFGDASASTQEHPTHGYALAGDYTVKLTVSGEGGSDSVSQVVSVTGT